jgi:predicted RNA-binding Zn ribbon-like protein
MHDWDRPAPGELWRVQRLINTLDLEDGSDELSSDWLVEHGLGAATALGPVRELREALRALLLSHNGQPVNERALATLTALHEPVAVAFGEDGVPRLGGDGPVARVLAIVATAAADGTWERLKACPADSCHWAFYDFSRNRSRTWCQMGVCGNRAKARAYRARQPKASA